MVLDDLGAAIRRTCDTPCIGNLEVGLSVNLIGLFEIAVVVGRIDNGKPEFDDEAMKPRCSHAIFCDLPVAIEPAPQGTDPAFFESIVFRQHLMTELPAPTKR